MATIPIITNASDLIRRLTAALMQYPRQSDAKPDVLGQFCKFFTPTVQQSKQLPVAGVATRGIDQVHLFFSSGGFKINRLEFDKFFGTEDMDVQSRYTGPFIPCAAGGDSIGYGSPSGATGTLGCIVTDVAKGRYLLGCNHVFANLNVGKIGDELWQPGSSDGGTSTDRVGVLHDVEAIHMGGYPKPHGCGRGKARSKGTREYGSWVRNRCCWRNPSRCGVQYSREEVW